MPTILVAADAAFVRDDVIAALSGDYDILVVTEGRDVRPAVSENNVHMAVVDMQMGSMGGIAVTMDLRLEESGGRIGHVPVLLLLDRRADVFLARRAGAEGFLVKPISPLKLRRAVTALMEGGEYEDTAHTPSPIVAT
ncbi:MAG: response regulator [Acidimicrobiales bacterium]|nr:response regulator [Acidimicrobiales bacterium]